MKIIDTVKKKSLTIRKNDNHFVIKTNTPRYYKGRSESNSSYYLYEN